MRLPNDARPFERLNSRFSACTQALLAIDRAEHEMHADVDAFSAPSECHALIDLDDDRKHALAQWGFTIEEYEAELKRRVSGRWAHFYGPHLPDDEK